MFTRRDFLRSTAAGVSFVSLAGGVPRLLARAAEESAAADRNDHVLVVVELSGGNDGLNTLIPFENPLYYQNRPTLGIPNEEVLQLSDQVGLHPRMGELTEQFKQGRLAVVQGVGYPEPDRSHFRSMEIWHTASTDAKVPTAGWLGKCLDAADVENDRLSALVLSDALPQALRAERVVVPVVSQLEAFFETDDESNPRARLQRKLSTAPGAAGPVAFMRKQALAVYRTAERLKDATSKYESAVEYPESGLGQQLRQAAQIIAADLGVRVLFVSQGGYDTHAGQAEEHANLLGDLSDSLAAFQRDLAEQQAADRVVALAFSEFGRRVDENASRGTDHGAGSCLFLLGSPVHGGLYGEYPSLEHLGDGDLVFNTDFRSVYATLLDGWLGCAAQSILEGEFPQLELLSS